MEFKLVNPQSIGGKKRAEKLTSIERSQIAKKAADSRWALPEAKYHGEVNFGDMRISCAVVQIGDEIHRLIAQREVVRLLTGHLKGGLDRYLEAKNLADYVPEKFKGKSLDKATIHFRVNGRKTHGYRGEDIVDICKMYLDARKKERLLPNQIHLAETAEIIITSLAKVGIVGLIDEATGYQAIRAKDALQEYLNKVLSAELSAWVKRFPDDFFEQIYRLKGWNYNSRAKNHPQIIGKYINNLVYARLGPGIKEELETRNPKNSQGGRKAKHHQWLSDDIGHPKLAQHLHTIVNFMKASDDWKKFMGMVERVFPITDSKQLQLFDN